MVTIKEIADRAGVSRGTVDRVLNNREGESGKRGKGAPDSPGAGI
ncbi:MAG: LacI family DNA-binding transcriptional regulator [Eisenbergiella massiliensis]